MKYYPLTHVFTLNNMTYETHFTTTPTWRVIHVVTTPERHRHITWDYIKITYQMKTVGTLVKYMTFNFQI